MKNKQKSTVTKKNEFLGTPTIQHDTYIYRFADGTSSTLVFGPADVAGLGSRWLAELQELDRCEYNNNHAQTRRHCSLEAQDPEGMGGYYEGDNMDRVQFNLEVKGIRTFQVIACPASD